MTTAPDLMEAEIASAAKEQRRRLGDHLQARLTSWIACYDVRMGPTPPAPIDLLCDLLGYLKSRQP